jgi:hypothetical protein
MAPTLRTRNGQIAPVNGYSLVKTKFSKVKKTIGKKKENVIVKSNKKRVRIFDDTLLDMFQFFKLHKLCSFKLVNRRMKRVVELGDQKNQHRQLFDFHEIRFSVCLIYFCT